MIPFTQPFARPSRRSFLRAASACAAAFPSLAAPSGPSLAYAATYSSPQGPEGSVGRGSGIVLFEMDRSTGALRQRDLFPLDNNPSWLILNSSRTRLYSANETNSFNGAPSGSVSAFSIDPASARLRLLNTVSSEGAGPCHISLHPSGRFLFVADYAGGAIAVLPVAPDGSLSNAVFTHLDQGPVGPPRASSAPPGSMAISGHDKPHAHMIQSDPSGRWVLSADLGLDRLLIWRFDPSSGRLTPNDPPFASLPPGDGPRHFLFHPTRPWLYSLQEEASTLVLWDWDARLGRLRPRQTVSTLPRSFRGTNFTSELALSPDGRFLYAANRLHDTIAWLRLAPNGEMTWAGEEWTRGDYPRSFTFDPSARFLYSCNQRGDAITCFRIDPPTGALRFTGQYTAAGTPAALVFLS